MDHVLGVEMSSIEKVLILGSQWLRKVCVVTKTGRGWPEVGGEPDVTIWGGTLDGVLGLLCAGASAEDECVAGGLRFLRAARSRDHGWPMEETGWPLIDTAESVVDVTAWITIVLKTACGTSWQEPILQEAADLLVQTCSPYGGWGSFRGGIPNMYATALAMWALIGLNDDIVRIQLPFVLDAINPDGGWGFLPSDNKSRIALTGLLLYVLLLTEMDLPGEVISNTMEWFRAHQTRDRTWENELDAQILRGGRQIYYSRVRHFSISWVVRAMLKAAGRGYEMDLSPSIKKILDLQQPEGYWAYSIHDHTPYVWCTQNAICTLAEARQAATEYAEA
ncbi:MAG: hypothetical protein SXV54_09280 [Chloroflexota bacterium]|nr:hypothetical protein [Chloroflexota bacterium]